MKRRASHAPHVKRRPACGPYRGTRAERRTRWGRAEGARHVLEAHQLARDFLILEQAQRQLEGKRAALMAQEIAQRAELEQRLRSRSLDRGNLGPLRFTETLLASRALVTVLARAPKRGAR